MFANVILNYKTNKIDRLFTYRVSDELKSQICVGDRVLVPFGRGDKYSDALVYELTNESQVKNLKDIIEILPRKFSLSQTQLFLIRKLKSRYAATYQSAFQCVLPSVHGLDLVEKYIVASKKLGPFCEADELSKQEIVKHIGLQAFNDAIDKKELKMFRDYKLKFESKVVEFAICNFENLDSTLAAIKSNALKQLRILKHIFGAKKVPILELQNSTNSTRTDIMKLVGMGFITTEVEMKDSIVFDNSIKAKNIMDLPLSSEQQFIVSEYDNTVQNSAIKNGNSFKSLIHGVTGSGKTRVYMELAKRTIEAGKQVLILLPEISLTPQIIGIFGENITDKISVIHTHIAPSEKVNEFIRIKKHEAQIVIGARSALFAPFANLGLIVMDEAHETSYQSDTTPRYDTRELAFDLSSEFGASLVYGSATPTISLLNLVDMGYLKKYNLKNRIGVSTMPAIKLIDMRNRGEDFLISSELISAMKTAFDRGEQVILFHNRKGYANYLQCSACGHVPKCVNCDITLKVHEYGKSLNCNYCSYHRKMDVVCEKCLKRFTKDDFVGVAIEKYIQILEDIFTGKRFERVDALSMNTQKKLLNTLESFNIGEIDCLIGTQILAKGLDFPNVTLIGILDADQLTNMPDYMAMERGYQLMAQVSGRAGRAEKKGTVLIQTKDPTLDIYKYLIKNDFDGFIANESKIRRALSYPPFSRMYMVVVSGDDQKDVIEQAHRIYEVLKSIIEKNNISAVIYEPSSSYYTKLKNKYHYHAVLKSEKCDYNKLVNIFYKVIVQNDFGIINENCRITLDFNPVFM